MGNPIRTTNQTGAEIKTRKVSTEGIGGWVDRHCKNVVAEWEAGEFSVTNELCTCWIDGIGNAQCECTVRNDGETDAQFLSRHIGDATTLMVQHPPAP